MEANIDDLLNCNGITIGSPEYFGTMAGMIKDFFDRTYEAAKDLTTTITTTTASSRPEPDLFKSVGPTICLPI
jgi:multimeric flavodoxin WrbA